MTGQPARFYPGQTVTCRGGIKATVLRELAPDSTGRRYSIRRDGAGRAAAAKEADLRHLDESWDQCGSDYCRAFTGAAPMAVPPPDGGDWES